MKIYSEYKSVIKKLGKIEKAYFTTFNLDIGFVEKYLLPPLFKDDIPDNKFSLEDLNLSIMKNKFDIKIFHDANMLTTFEKKTLIQTYPILIRAGVFHPKVIYIKGSDATYLFVGSGNLTISGWGRNIEAFEIIDISYIQSLENQVLNFFDDVYELAGLNRQNKTYRKSENSSQNFIYSFHKSKNTNSPFLEALNIKKKLQIFSPYFSDDLDKLFENNEFKSLDEINVIPDLIENQKIRLKVLPSIDKRVSFYRFNKKNISYENEDSTNHSKIWISDNKFAIGSYNCTQAALYGNNFEASIVKSYSNKEDFLLENFKNIDNLETSGDKNNIEEEIVEEMRYSSLFKLVANFTNFSFELYSIISKIHISKISINLPSFNDKLITCSDFKKLEYSKRVQVFRALTKNKVYKIYNENNECLFRGIIIEVNASFKTRLIDSAETLEDVFLSFSDVNDPTEGKQLKPIIINLDREDEDIYKRKNQETTVNYYNMFSGFQNLTNKYEDIKENEEKLKRFCFLSSASLIVIKSILESNFKDEDLFIYLTVLEFNKLVSKRNVTGISKIIEPKITLLKADKKFIKEMIK